MPRPPGFKASACARTTVGELVAAGVLERADRQQLVVLARNLAEVAFDELDLVAQAAPLDLARASSATCAIAVLMPVPSAPYFS